MDSHATAEVLLNPHTQATLDSGTAAVTPGLATFHERLPDWSPTPLVRSPELRSALGVRDVSLKLELSRLGLPSFKIAGASWAVFRALDEWIGGFAAWDGVGDLRAQVHGARSRPTLVTATDGNHGRAVARSAALFGASARIYVPASIAGVRVEAIASEGADVVSVNGTYDDAVDAAHEAANESHLLVADTALSITDEGPQRVIEGYSTIFRELDAQLPSSPQALFVQMGVGSLAAAAVRHFRATVPAMKIIGVEPVGADCCAQSVAAGSPVLVPGPHRSVMAGLNCGRPSAAAWPDILRGVDAFVTISDDAAEWALRVLAAAGFEAGESGAAGVAAALALAADGTLASVLPDVAASHVLFLITEGPTDPASFEMAVGRPPTAVAT